MGYAINGRPQSQISKGPEDEVVRQNAELNEYIKTLVCGECDSPIDKGNYVACGKCYIELEEKVNKYEKALKAIANEIASSNTPKPLWTLNYAAEIAETCEEIARNALDEENSDGK